MHTACVFFNVCTDCCNADREWRPEESDIDSQFLANMTRMLDERLNLKIAREEQQKEKLDKWIREEQVRRWKEQQRKKRESEAEMQRLQQQLLLNDDGQPPNSSPLTQVT